MCGLTYNKTCSDHSTGQIQDNLNVKTRHYEAGRIVCILQESEIHFQLHMTQFQYNPSNDCGGGMKMKVVK